MSCNNCIHKEVCIDRAVSGGTKGLADKCKNRKDESRFIELPCKVGDTVYQITRNFISEFKVTSIRFDNVGFLMYWEICKGIYINVMGFSDDEIGKTVFLTREEAEKALKKGK